MSGLQDSPTTPEPKQHRKFTLEDYKRIQKQPPQTIDLEKTVKSSQDSKPLSLEENLEAFKKGIESLDGQIGHNPQVKEIFDKASQAAEKLLQEKQGLNFPADKNTEELMKQLETFNNSYKQKDAAHILIPMLNKMPNIINKVISTITEGVQQENLNPEAPDKEIENQNKRESRIQAHSPLSSEITRAELISVHINVRILNDNTINSDKDLETKQKETKALGDARTYIDKLLITLEKHGKIKLISSENESNKNLIGKIAEFSRAKDDNSKFNAIKEMTSLIKKVTEGIKQAALDMNSSHSHTKGAGRGGR